MALLRTSFRTLSPNLFFLVLILAASIPVTRAVFAFSPSSTFTTTSRLSRSPLPPQKGDLFIPPPPPPSSSSSPFAQSSGSTLPLPFNSPVAYSSNDHVQLHQKVSSTAPELLGIHLLHSCSDNRNKHSNKNNNRNGYLQHHTHRRSMPYSDQDVTMDSQSGQQQQRQEQQPQEWNQPSGTAFAEGLPLWTPGTASRRPFRHPFVKSFGLRHKATMDWGMRARARTQKHWDKYWDQLENPQASGFGNLDDTGTAHEVGIGTNFNSETGAIIADATCTDARTGTGIAGAGGSGGDNNNKGLPGEENMSSYPEMISDDHGASASTPFASDSYASSAPCVPALNCTHNSNLDSNIDSCNTSYTDASSSIASPETMLTAVTMATAIKDNGLARAEAEPPKVPPDYISPPLGDNDGPGSLFFSQLLNHYDKPPSSFPITPTTNADPVSTSDFSSPFDNIINSRNNNNGATHTNATFRQYYQINREFYKPGGPIILWLPGESPLHSLFLRRGLAYELANATAGLLVALEHRFYGNSIPRFQDSPVSHKAGPIVFDAGRGKQESPSSTSSTSSQTPLPDMMLSDPDFDTLHMKESPTTKEGRQEGEEEEREIQGYEGGEDNCMAKDLSSSSPSSPNSSPTEFNHLTTVDKVSGVIIKGDKHKGISKGDKEQPPHNPHEQPDKINDDNNNGNNDNNDNDSSTARVEKEGLPLDLLKYLNVDQSIEDIARFMDLFPSLQPKLFSENESSNDPLAATAPTTPRWILAGCSYGGNLAAWTRQRYPSKVFAAFASSAPVRSALDFFEYSTSQIDILGDKCSSQLGHARDFLDSALGMTDEFMQQMAAVDLEVDEQTTKGVNTSGVLPFAVATGQEHERFETDTNNDMVHLSTLSPFLAPTTDPASVVGSDNDDKARRQAAKLRVLTWFSPDFAHEYAAEGEEIHAAGWIWWTVASAVQYNAVVTPATVQPVKTAVDILCDTMDLTKIDDLLRSNSPHSDVSNSNLPSQLKLQYTKALASWFKDQQFFTPTKQEDLQPADLDPTSVQSLAGMAWLWQTCSELGYLQTAHPSTCCCPSLSKPTPPVQSAYDSIIIKDFSNSSDEHRTGSSNATCPLTSGDNNPSQETFYSTKESFFLTRTTTPESASATAGAGSTCLPCRCYADKAHKSESVFSRLLTLEAAWQECQFYFSSTHPPARNPITKPSTSSCSSTSPSPLSSLWSLKETTDWNISTQQQQQQPPGSVDEDPNSTNPQRQQSGPGSVDIHPLVTLIINSGTTTTQQQQQNDPVINAIKRDEVLLMGYPDVETNVNTKFHGWEIAQDPCYPSGSTVDHEIGLEGGNSGEGGAGDAGDNYPRSDEIQFASSSTASIVDEELGTIGQEEDDEDEEDDNEDDDKVVASQSGTTPRIASELDDWLMDHPGGRYYFTNGEKDPWKELTLASSRAIEFLRRPKVGGSSGNGYRNGDAGNGDNNGSGRRVYFKDSLEDQTEGLLESVETLESAPLTGQSARKGRTRQDKAEIIKEEEDSLVGKKLSLSQDATFGTLPSNNPTYRHHHKAARHRSHHRRRHHPQKHHHHHHHKHHSPRKHTRKRKPKHRLPPRPPPCAPSTIDPCPPFPFHTPNSGGSGSVETRLSQPKLSDQDENDNVTGSDGSGVVVVVDKNKHEDEKDEGNTGGSVSGSGGGGSGLIGEEEFGDRTVMRIISEASHCQDILYESNDLHSVKLRAEREHVLRTFVRWIEIDNRRQLRVLERQQQKQQQMFIIILALMDMILVLSGYQISFFQWWGVIVGFFLSLFIFVFYLFSVLRKEQPKLNMITRAFLVLFLAVFLLGIKFSIIDILVRVNYDMANCPAVSLCHAFNAEIVFSVIMGFMVIFEAYVTLKGDKQEILSRNSLPADDIESQMSTMPSSQAQDFSSAVNLVESSNVVRPGALPAQSDSKKPRVDAH
ncbi:MAG: hypothetical protein J3R72DRAFT_527838 [Linnemannia gamsii]|nr:MAG: hypothetical protein J3R72DRAFT_527838 [Linnemannia gamsii]